MIQNSRGHTTVFAGRVHGIGPHPAAYAMTPIICSKTVSCSCSRTEPDIRYSCIIQSAGPIETDIVRFPSPYNARTKPESSNPIFGIHSKIEPKNMDTKTHTQELQERQYAFPYHYIPQWQPHFTQQFNYNWGINYVSTLEFILNKLDDLSFTSIVDIGCGDGRFTRELSLRFPDCKTTGIDYSDTAISLANAMNRDMETARFECIDITGNETIQPSDVAILMEVFEHIPPAEGAAFLHGVARLLAPKGTLLLTVPHKNLQVSPKHFRHFSSEMIHNELSGYFHINEIVPFERITIGRKIISGLLSNRIFSLSHKATRDFLYAVYKKYLFPVNHEDQCQRLFIKATVR